MNNYYSCHTTCNCACNDNPLNVKTTHHRRVMVNRFTLAIKDGDSKSIIQLNLAKPISKLDEKNT